jgi:hypothetical protein
VRMECEYRGMFLLTHSPTLTTPPTYSRFFFIMIDFEKLHVYQRAKAFHLQVIR